MTIEIEILSSAEEFASLRETWNAMVREDSHDLLGQDGTSTFEWFEAIINAFPEASKPRVIIARENGRVSGILPLLQVPGRLAGTGLVAPTELYGGRNGPILLEANEEVLAAILKSLDLACPGWSTYRLTLVTNSASAEITEHACRTLHYPIFIESASESLFFPVDTDEEAYWSGMGRDLKQRIRRAEKLLSQQNVQVHVYEQGDNADNLLRDVLAVERKSWKHEAGSAITNHPRQENFYRVFFPLGLESGILKATVLHLDGEPIAYVFGLFRDHVFCSLKTSMAMTQEKLSPSHVAHHMLIQDMRYKGMRMFDFMGVIDQHKLRWSKRARTYERKTWIVHSNNLGGHLTWWLGKVKSLFRSNAATAASTDRHAE